MGIRLSGFLEFDENNIPSNILFGDTYYSKMGGLDETYEVFIRPTEIDKKIKIQNDIIIGETGFGTGLNFLAVLKEFEESAAPNATLQFYTFEKYLMDAENAGLAHSNFPQIKDQSEKLLRNWPKNVKGLHSIEIVPRVFLNIFIGDANETMELCEFKADAWFLDGFAPSKNPDFWNDTIFSQIARLIKPDGIIATYSVASLVREGLQKSGFVFEKLAGFANKKHRLIARPQIPTPSQTHKKAEEIVIIGAGIAGLCLGHYAAKFGIKATIFDNDIEGKFKASNNPRGICMPRLDRTETTQSRFFKTAYLHALRFYEDLGIGFERTKIKEPAKSERDIEKFQIFAKNPPLPPEFLTIEEGTLIHNSALVEPPIVCDKLRESLEIRGEAIKEIIRREDKWILIGENNEEVLRTNILINAAGAGTNKLLNGELPISGREGVVSISDFEWPKGEMPIAAGGYAIPFQDKTIFGATFERVKLEKVPEILEDSHEKNLENIAKFAPELANKLKNSNITGRASMRAASKDQIPIAGEIRDRLFVLGALGSRGFSLAPFLAQMLIMQIAHGNLSVETQVAKLVSPHRFGNQFSNI